MAQFVLEPHKNCQSGDNDFFLILFTVSVHGASFKIVLNKEK